MNRCEFCGAAGTIHLTDIQQNATRVMHLCERCGRERELISTEPQPQLNLTGLLQLLLVEMKTAAKPATPHFTTLTCPCCGLKYAQFRTAGRFGCPDDYDLFREPLMPLLERIHRATDHAGKAPRSRQAELHTHELKNRLAAAVAAENYESAAELRDTLRRKDIG